MIRLAALVATLLFSSALSFGAPRAETLDDAKGERLTSEQIRDAFTGATFRGKTAPGRPFTFHYAADGTMTGRTPGGRSDFGHWSVENDRICRRWNRWFRASRICFAVVRDGDVTTWFYPKTGKMTHRGTLSK